MHVAHGLVSALVEGAYILSHSVDQQTNAYNR